MYLNEPLLKAVSAGSAGRFLKDGESLRSQPLGELYLPTGKIVANDPCCLFEGTPFTRTVPPGSYPVNLWVWEGGGDKRVAFAGLRFREGAPVRFEMALLAGQDTAELSEDGFYGYGVDSGTGGFMDEQTFLRLTEGLEEWEGGIFSALDDALEKSYVDTYSAANVRLPDSEYNVAAFSSGWGDGGYPSYWGFDAEGQLCCLMTDFCILDL